MLDPRTLVPTFSRCKSIVTRAGITKFSYEIREFFDKTVEDNWREYEDGRRWFLEALERWREEHNRGVEVRGGGGDTCCKEEILM